MIQFSGIGCAPCHAAIPFLKQLTEDYRDRSFELVRIECWSNNVDVITKYCSSNGIKYRFLISDREIDKKYNAIAVPIFFVLDGNKKIHKIIRGYSKETTDKEIRDAIEKLL